ncbi:hypothetical protein ABEH87_16785 [Erwinia sp. Eh17-17]|uniref:hypothetical protein n=1 Tax=Erwinia sp. Eh17-17 TaxID=3080330 RepID=UPI00320A34A4
MKKIVLICAVMLVPHSFADECNADEIMVASCNLPGKVQRLAVFCAKKIMILLGIPLRKITLLSFLLIFLQRIK